MKNLMLTGACALLFLSCGQIASAGMIYNEDTIGVDLPNGGAAGYHDLGTLLSGTFYVKGAVDGGATNSLTDGSDEQDAITFALTGATTINLDWHYLSNSKPLAQLYDSSFSLVGEQSFGTNIFGTLAAGDYYIVLAPTDNTGISSYRMTFNVAPSEALAVASVPLPATGLLLMAGLGGLASVRRRRRG